MEEFCILCGHEFANGNLFELHRDECEKLFHNIAETLVTRGHKYGASFAVQSETVQHIKAEMARSVNWKGMTADKREALEMIATKISRILNGDPDYHDSWHDISGYAKLVADTLKVEP